MVTACWRKTDWVEANGGGGGGGGGVTMVF